MQSYFAVIIGAGPGGLACARLLAEQGRKVLVLERKKEVGPKVCGGGITWSGLIRRVPETLVEKSFPGQQIRTPGQRITVSAPDPIIATVNRRRLGQWMYDQAVAAGARVLTNTRACTITGQEVVTRKERFQYQYLIGADGSSSLVRKHLGLPCERVGYGLHYEVPGNFPDMEWHLNTSLFGNGYAWIFPHQGLASVGVYTADLKKSPRALQENLHRWAGEQGITLAGLSPRAGRINFDFRGWRFGNTFLVGDAAGLASGLTGEGMYPAIVSGETVARVILEPDHAPVELERLLHKHRVHTRVLAWTGAGSLSCSLAMELLCLGLRLRLIPFRALEMA